MKRTYLSLAFGLFAFVSLWGQKKYVTHYEVQYLITSHLDSLHLDDEIRELGFLYTGAGYGVYVSYLKAQRSGLLTPAERRELGLDTKQYFNKNGINPSLNRAFYKNHQTGKTTTVAMVPLGKTYAFEEPQKLVWQIKDSTRQIKGYPVQKAMTHFAGRDYVAWFSPQVPIPDGPFVFSGLPGLIIKLCDTDGDYDFTLYALKKLSSAKVFPRPETDTISKKKFRSLYKIAKKNWPENMMAQTFPPNPNRSDEMKEKIRKFYRQFKQMNKSQNNPIELQ